MAKECKISFVVPIYNAEKYLNECVESLINQTDKGNYEIILVNDGSKDSSIEICNKFADKYRNIIVIDKENGGVCEARQSGVMVANGEYIVCVDADDIISSEFVKETIDLLSKYQCDVYCFNYNDVDEKGNFLKEQRYRYSGMYLKEEKIFIYDELIKATTGKQFPPSIWSKIIKKDLLLRCMKEMDNRIKIGEDMCLSVNCVYNADSLYFIDKALYNYRINSSSVTKRRKAFPWKDVDYKIDFLTKILPLDKHDFYLQICRSTVHSLFNVACSVINSSDSYKDAKKEIIENLSKEKYKQYIKDCTFTSTKEKLALFSIKHKCVWLMKMFCNIWGK